MDLYCQVCGEPWEVFGLWDFETDEYKGARQDFINGVGCPCCTWGASKPMVAPPEAQISRLLHDMLGDDIDGIAVEMEDALGDEELLKNFSNI